MSHGPEVSCIIIYELHEKKDVIIKIPKDEEQSSFLDKCYIKTRLQNKELLKHYMKR